MDAKAVSGVIELSRVADGTPSEIRGVVFLGTAPGGKIGRSVSGAVDVDGDGVPDILIGGDNEAWIIPGAGPKSKSGASRVDKDKPFRDVPTGPPSK